MAEGRGNLEALIARIDERTEQILNKLDDICEWRSEAAKVIAEYQASDLPRRVRDLERFCWGLSAAIVLLAALMGWKMVVFP